VWAENLAFDGHGNLFVSSPKNDKFQRGEVWRISLCEDLSNYCGNVHLTMAGLGGFVMSKDGSELYIGATLDDGSSAIVKTKTSSSSSSSAAAAATDGDYTLVVKTDARPNGFAADWESNTLFWTHEGFTKTESEGKGGAISSYNLDTSVLINNVASVPNADGLRFDDKTRLLYAGDLISKEIHVFSVSDNGQSLNVLGVFDGLSKSENALHLLDDFTLGQLGTNPVNLNDTIIYGADWTSNSIRKFTLDGKLSTKVELPDGIKIRGPTSVRWGVSDDSKSSKFSTSSFDPNSIYVTEGGCGGFSGKCCVVQIPITH